MSENSGGRQGGEEFKLEIIITTVRYDYYVYRLLNMYLLTNYVLTNVVLRLHDVRTRFLLLGFVIMLDKSIRRK